MECYKNDGFHGERRIYVLVKNKITEMVYMKRK